MTAIVVPVPVPSAALPIPDSADLSTWPARMKELHRWMRNDAAPAMSALGEASYQNALHAVAMADSAAGAANFKGAWSALTGALNMPASVSHSGRLWLLTANLANVATATPGVSGSWLDVSNFLMGVSTASAARTALDVYSKAEVDSEIIASVPAGAIVYFARNTAPTGYIKANGVYLSRITYATLFSAIGTTFGAGDGVTSFAIPDLRGEFVRGWDDGRLIDGARAFGSFQNHSLAPHQHYLLGGSGSVSDYQGGSEAPYGTGIGSIDTSSKTASTGVDIATETRPRNIALLACIKY